LTFDWHNTEVAVLCDERLVSAPCPFAQVPAREPATGRIIASTRVQYHHGEVTWITE
jgi:hypothetical protein